MKMLLKVCYILVTFLKIIIVSSQRLRPGGYHVCARSISYNTHHVVRLTRVGYYNYGTCCARFLWWCTSHCTRYRTMASYYTQKELRPAWRTQYYCCTGWAPSGNQCTIPICRPGCQNGYCTAPNRCTCNVGFHGSYCEKDIVECQNNPCQQTCKNLIGSYACECKEGYVKSNPREPKDKKCADVDECTTLKPCKCTSALGGCKADCHNYPGSYKCSCGNGFQLMFDGKTCADIDECKQPAVSKCQQNCQNKAGSFICYCNKGYLLHTNKQNCTDVDECATLNGGCNQICINQPGTYECACKPGYRLSTNKKTCDDIDECQENTPCDNLAGICRNLPGTFLCSCKPGYFLMNDNRTCQDLDECSNASLNTCTQKCNNNVGSYTCSCDSGYRLSKNQQTCEDRDECAEKQDSCQQICHNNIGSFTCSCRSGYKLAADNISCIALPCETIVKPGNGNMSCNGSTTGSHCTIWCNDGYVLVGSVKRVCEPTRIWSGTSPTCKPKTCPAFPLPNHGSVLLPCIELVGFSCMAKCREGYYLSGNHTSKCVMNNGITTWVPNNAICEASTPCDPNPCLHGGTCKEESINAFSCDCSGTSFSGKSCQIGLVSMPGTLQLEINQTSEELTAYAKPDKVLHIRPKYDKNSLKFVPEKITIYPSYNEAKFQIRVLQPGSFKIEFRVVGLYGTAFKKPNNLIVYGFQKVDTQPVDVDTNFLDNNCNKIILKKCDRIIKLTSSCSWSKGTNGFVGVESENLNIPLSLVGIDEKTERIFSTIGFLNPSNELKQYLTKRNISMPCVTPCNNNNYNNDAIDFITKSNIFQRAYLKNINSILPSWLQINIDPNERYFDAQNFVTFLGDSTYVRKMGKCPLIDTSVKDMYSIYLPKSTLRFSVGSTLISATDSEKTTCFAINLCKNTFYISLNEKNYLNYAQEIAGIGIKNIILKVKGFAFGVNKSLCTTFDKKEECAAMNAYADILLSSSFNFKKTSFSFEGRLYTALNDKAVVDSCLLMENYDTALEKFSKERQMLLKGTVLYKFVVTMFGSSLKIRGKSTKSEIFIKLGGFGYCPICDNKGSKLILDSDIVNFDYPTSLLRFTIVSKLHVYIPHNFDGGIVLSLDQTSKNRLYVAIQSLKRNVPVKINQLSQALETISKQRAIIAKYGKRFERTLEKFKQSLVQADFAIVQEKLQNLKSATDDLRAHLNAVFASHPGNTRILILTRILSIQLRNVDQLNLALDSESITNIEQGQIISFDGSICLYELCFYNVNIKIFDLPKSNFGRCSTICQSNYSNSLIKNAVTIEVTSLTDQYLSKRIQIKKNMKMKIVISKDSNNFATSFTSFINYFGNYSQALISILNDTIQVNAGSVHMLEKKSFIIKSKHNLSTATWKNIIKKVNGISYQAGKELMQNTQNVYSTIATKTVQRLKSILDRLKNASQDLKYGQLKFYETIKKLNESQTMLRIEEALHGMYLLQENYNQTVFNSYVRALEPGFIQRNVDSVCKIEKCKDLCIPMSVCETCKDPLVLEVPTLKCETKTQQIRINIMSPKQRQCPLTKYKFTPVYTGTCKISPQEQTQSDAQLRGALQTTGSVIGGIISSVIPGVGFLLGSVIGGFLGGIFSLFSSCDKSYTVEKSSTVELKDCVLLVPDVRTITRPYSECFDIKVKAQTGFKVPYTCNCKVNDCITKSPNQDCLTKNQACDTKRKDFLARTASVPLKFTNLYKALKTSQNNVAASVLKIHTLKKRLKYYQQEYERSSNVLKVLQEEENFAKKSYSAVITALKTEACISREYSKLKNISELIHIKNIKFDGSFPIVNNIRLNAQIQYQGKDILMPFVYDRSNDYNVTMKAFSRKILASVVCKRARRRRSVEGSTRETDLAFKPWYLDPNATASLVKISCVTLRRTLEFLRDTVISLDKKISYANNLSIQLSYSSYILNPMLQKAFSVHSGRVSPTNGVLKANQALLISANNELNELKELVSVKSILNSWQNEAEIMTGYQNISACFSHNDCIDNAIDTLTNLPTMLNKPRKIYIQEILSLKGNFINLLRETNLTRLILTVKNIVISLSNIESMSLHCVDPPLVKIVNAGDINVEEGAKLSLKCSAKSSLPMQYYWNHNDEILDDENSDELHLFASEETQGIYACIAKSLAGNGTSSQVRVILFAKPKFIEEPGEIFYILPSYQVNSLTLTCNATDYPETTITWYHKPMTLDGQPRVISNKTGLLLVINDPIQQNSGYYSCQALNKYGKIKSREAKIEILHSRLVDPEINLSFEILNTSTVSANSFHNLSTEMLAEIKGLDKKMNITTINDHNVWKVTFKIEVSANIKDKISLPEMFNISTKMRQNMATSVAVFMTKLVKNQFHMRINEEDMALVDNETITYGFKLNICKNGFKLHNNGYLCVQCPYGTAGRNCNECAVNTYADIPGLPACKQCDTEKITEQTGSIRKSQCIIPRARKTDIILIIDSTQQFFCRLKCQREIKIFIRKFVSAFNVDRGNTRFALLAYAKYVDTLITLNEYKDQTDLLSLLDDLTSKTFNVKDTTLALYEARKIFRKESSDDRKKVVVIFTNGFSRGYYNRFGFTKTRREAIALQNIGAHLISIGIGRIDFDTLRALASYPKLYNSLFPRRITKALKQTLNLVDGYLGEKCYLPGIDFGILYNRSTSLSDDQMTDAATKIQQLLLPIYKTFKYQSYNFIWSVKSKKYTGFKSYSEKTFVSQIQNYVKRPISFRVYEDITASVKTQLTELHRSFSKVKYLLVITEIPLDEEALRPLQVSFYGEKINIYNFVLDSSLVEKYDGPFSTETRLGRLVYGADDAEIDEFIQVVKNKSHRICQ